MRQGYRGAVHSFLCVAAGWCLSLLWLPSAQGVIDANSQSNTNPPASGSPWSHVGTVNGSSGVYLGGGWMATAAHVGPGNTWLNGNYYIYDGISHRITNSSGTDADMVMYHLSTAPALARLPLASASPGNGAAVDMIGYGRIATNSETLIGAYTGFYWSAGHYKSWGNNKVDAGGLVTQDYGMGPTTMFKTTFDAAGQTSDEGQASQGDSGGGVFRMSSGVWSLVGMMVTISGLPGQPADTSAYGNSTLSVDIATYRTQIQGVMGSVVPNVAIARSGANVLVSWPDTGTGYLMQKTVYLVPSSWGTITPTLSTNSGFVTATIPASSPSGYFRLRKP